MIESVNPHVIVFKTPKQYIEARLKLLRRDFRIFPTPEELRHLYSLTTETDINLAIRGIINEHWK